MGKTKILLFVMLFTIFSPLVFAEWLQYGSDNFNSHNWAVASGSSINFSVSNTYPTGIGGMNEPIIYAENGGLNLGNQTAILWSSGGTLTLISLPTHSVINTFATGVSPLGQFEYKSGRVFGIFKESGVAKFKEYEINENLGIFQFFSQELFNYSGSSQIWGTKCDEENCVFNLGDELYDFSIANLTYLNYHNATLFNDGVRILADKPEQNEPMILTFGAGQRIAYFTGVAGSGNSDNVICAYDITNRKGFVSGNLGTVMNSCYVLDSYAYDNHITNPSFIESSGGSGSIVVGTIAYYGTDKVCLWELGSGAEIGSGSPRCYTNNLFTGNLVQGVTQPFRAKCKFSDMPIAKTGLGLLADTNDGIFPYISHLRLFFLDFDGVFHTATLESAKRNQTEMEYLSQTTGVDVATADFDGDTTYEMVVNKQNVDLTYDLAILSCNGATYGTNLTEIQTIASNTGGIYGITANDFDGNGQIDILVSRSGSTKEIGNTGSALVEACGNGYCGAGETHSNCPFDCPIEINEGNYSQLNLQTQLVDINSNNPLDPTQTRGLLPELYLGIMSFFKGAFIPFFLIMIFVMLVLLVFAFGRKIISKIG